MNGHLAVGTLNEKIDGELFISHLPKAQALLLISPRRDFPDKWDVKLRLGSAAPEGARIHRILPHLHSGKSPFGSRGVLPMATSDSIGETLASLAQGLRPR